MTVSTLNFLPKPQPLNGISYKKAVREIIFAIELERDLTDGELAQLIFCDEGTLSNAKNKRNKLNAVSLLNLLLVSPSALEILLHHFNRRSAPIHQTHEADSLTAATNIAHKLAVASDHPSGQPNDIACLKMEVDVDQVIEAMCAIKSRCINWRKAHAA